jgi:hypothetical protein
VTNFGTAIPSYISDLLTVFNSRPDLQSAFPEVNKGNFANVLNSPCPLVEATQNNILTWAAQHGVIESSSSSLLTSHVAVYKAMEVYSQRPDLQQAFPEANNAANLSKLFPWAATIGISDRAADLGPQAAVYRLMQVYYMRPDLQAAFPEAANADNLLKLLTWASTNGIMERPDILSHNAADYKLMQLYFARPDLQAAFPQAANPANLSNLLPWASTNGISERPDLLASNSAVYKLMQVYYSRPDLQNAFPEAANAGVLTNIYAWANVHGFIEAGAILGANTGQYVTPP